MEKTDVTISLADQGSGWQCMAAVAAGCRKGLVTTLGDSAWRLLQLANEWVWSGYEPAKNLRRKLWITFLGLTPGRSGNTSERWD